MQMFTLNNVLLIPTLALTVTKLEAYITRENWPIYFNTDIKAVDREICETLKSPRKDVKQESKLMKNLQRYYEYLDNINDRIDRRWREADNVKVMMDKVGQEGPQMIYVPVDAEAFKKAYEWDDDDVDTMKTTVLGIKYMWDQVTRKVNSEWYRVVKNQGY